MFYDVLQIMPLGHARPVTSLDQVLREAHFVTLHVPETPETRDMIGEKEFNLMQDGSYFINASRGSVVDVDALARALRSGHLAGAAVDVFPKEPFKNGQGFESPLLGCPNTILTPHIGGSTEEAQEAIGREVAAAFIKFARQGTTLGAVNFPEADLRLNGKRVARVLHVHHNVPGVLRTINEIVGGHNVEKQICDNRGELAYLMMDISLTRDDDLERIKAQVESTQANIKTRILI
jgi:D-3-phosphoglycerate dehydrogenase